MSFDGGFHFEGLKIFEITDVSPLTALLITLVMTLSFGWFQGYVIVKSGIASFIVTLGGLFFLRGLTEVCYRAFNKAPDQTAGSTTVTDLPDIKNIINVPGHGEMERDAAKALSNEELIEILKTAPQSTVQKLTEQLTYINEKVAITKTLLQKQKMVDTMQNTLDNAIKSGNEAMVEAIQKKDRCWYSSPRCSSKICNRIGPSKSIYRYVYYR